MKTDYDAGCQMESLDYQEYNQSRRAHRHFRRGVFWALWISLVVGILATLPIAWDYYKFGQSISAFNTKTSDANLLGRTPDQIIAWLGQPEAKDTLENGDLNFFYSGPDGRVCRVEIRNGRVQQIARWTK